MRVVQAPHPRSPYGVRSARSTRTCIMHRPTASSMQSLSGDTLVRATQAAHAFVDQLEWRRADRKAERVCEIAIDRECLAKCSGACSASRACNVSRLWGRPRRRDEHELHLGKVTD